MLMDTLVIIKGATLIQQLKCNCYKQQTHVEKLVLPNANN